MSTDVRWLTVTTNRREPVMGKYNVEDMLDGRRERELDRRRKQQRDRERQRRDRDRQRQAARRQKYAPTSIDHLIGG